MQRVYTTPDSLDRFDCRLSFMFGALKNDDCHLEHRKSNGFLRQSSFLKCKPARRAIAALIRLLCADRFLLVFYNLMTGASFHHCKMKNSYVSLCKAITRLHTHADRYAHILPFSIAAQ